MQESVNSKRGNVAEVAAFFGWTMAVLAAAGVIVFSAVTIIILIGKWIEHLR